MAVGIHRELREFVLTLFSPIPFLVFCIYGVNMTTHSFFRLLFFYLLLAFAFIAFFRIASYLKQTFEETWDESDPTSVENENGPLRSRIWNLAEEWWTADSRESIQERERKPILPGLVFGTLNLAVSVVFYILIGFLLTVLARFGLLQPLLGEIKTVLSGPGGILLSTVSDFPALNLLVKSALSSMDTENLIFLGILFSVPGFFAVHAGRQFSHAFEQVQISFLKYLHTNGDSYLRHEATGVVLLFVLHLGVLL